MKQLVLIVFVFAFGVAMLAPSGQPGAPAAAPASASAENTQAAGLFEAAPYKETQLVRRPDGHFYVTADVNGKPTTFLIDTGASTVALTESDARAIGLQFSSSDFEPVARTATGVARGKRVTLRKVGIEGKDVTEVEAMIVEGAHLSLLGQSYLARISSVQMNGDHMVLR